MSITTREVNSSRAAQRRSTAGKTLDSAQGINVSKPGSGSIPLRFSGHTQDKQRTSIRTQSNRYSVQSSGRDSIVPTPGADSINPQNKLPEKRTSIFREEHEKRISQVELELPQYPQLSLRDALAKIAPRASILKANKFLAPDTPEPPQEAKEAKEATSFPPKETSNLDSVTNATSKPSGVAPGTGMPLHTSKQPQKEYNVVSLVPKGSSTPSQTKTVTAATALVSVSVQNWGMDYVVQAKVTRTTLRALRSWVQRFSGDVRALDSKGRVVFDDLQAKHLDEFEAVCARGFLALDKVQADTRALEAGRGYLTPEAAREEQPTMDESNLENLDMDQPPRSSPRSSESVTSPRRRGSKERGSKERGSVAKSSESVTSPRVAKSSESATSAEERQIKREIQKLLVKIESVQKRIKATERKRLCAEMQLKVLVGTKRRNAETQTDPPVVKVVESPRKHDELKPLRTRGNGPKQTLDRPKEDASWEEVACWQDQVLDLLQQRMKDLEGPSEQAAPAGSPWSPSSSGGPMIADTSPEGTNTTVATGPSLFQKSHYIP